MKTVVLNEGLVLIKAEAFADSAVKSVTLPKTLKKIGAEAFRGCENLKTIQLPECLDEISAKCFQSSGLKEITIPKDILVIRKEAFYFCKQLKKVTFAGDSRLKQVEDGAFWNTPLKRESVNIPSDALVSRDAF